MYWYRNWLRDYSQAMDTGKSDSTAIGLGVRTTYNPQLLHRQRPLGRPGLHVSR